MRLDHLLSKECPYLGLLVCRTTVGVVLGRVVWWGRNAWCKEPSSPVWVGAPPGNGGLACCRGSGTARPWGPALGPVLLAPLQLPLVGAGGCGGWLRGVGVLVVNCIVDASIFDLCAAAGLSVWWLLFCLFL